MAVRLFIADMDDTLLRNDQTIGARTEAALRQLRTNGIDVAFATGRMYEALVKYVHQLNINAPLITYNGAMIVDGASGRTLDRRFIDVDTARWALEECEHMGLYIQLYDENGWYYDSDCEHSRYYAKVSGVQGTSLGKKMSEAVREPAPKLLTINSPERTLELLPILKEKFAGRLEVAISKPKYIEITNPDANKGDALRRLCKMINILPEDVMACGDGINDIGMIEAAGIGVAVENARPEVKAHADVICGSNQDEGIAVLLENMFGGAHQ